MKQNIVGISLFINNSFPAPSHETLLILIKTRRTCFIFVNRTQVLTLQIRFQFSDHRRLTGRLLFLSLVITFNVVQSIATLKKKLPVFPGVSGNMQTVCILVLPMFS